MFGLGPRPRLRGAGRQLRGGRARLPRLFATRPHPSQPPAPRLLRAQQTLHLGGGRATGLQLPNDVSIPFRCVMPVAAGFAVAALQSKGFAPGLKFLTRAIEGVVDDSKTAALPKDYWQVRRSVI